MLVVAIVRNNDTLYKNNKIGDRDMRILLRDKTRSHSYNRQIRPKVMKKGALDLINTPYDRTFHFLARWAILAIQLVSLASRDS
jgi:hypothetical protein